jgi:hypothetical protein
LHWNRTRDPWPITMSDVITRRALHRLELHQYFCRPYGVEDCLSLRVSASGQLFAMSLTRAATTFQPRHRAVAARSDRTSR